MNAQVQNQRQSRQTLASSFTPVRQSLLQRKCACGGTPGVDGKCPACRAKRLGLQRQAASPATPAAVPPIVHEVLRSPGQPLLGHDFSHIQVHTGTRQIENGSNGNGPVPTGILALYGEDAPPAEAAAAMPGGKAFPTATFTDFLTVGKIRCCKDRGRGQCPANRGIPGPGDGHAQNGMNLVATINDHRAGIEYGFVQNIHFRKCIRFGAALGGGWAESDSGGPGQDDSPVVDATCPIPDARNQIVMTDAPGFPAGDIAGLRDKNLVEVTQRVNATDWVIARKKPGPWQSISELFHWHSTTGIRRNAAGDWELTPGANQIGRGFIKIGGCPPPVP